MRRTITVVLATVMLVAAAQPARAATQTVSIGDNFFSSSAKAVNRGDKVLWKNTGGSQHTTTGNEPLNFWASPTLGSGDTFTSPALTAAGTYPYHCTKHFGMAGKVTVPITLTKNVRRITVTLASSPADATHKFVVQRKIDNKFVTVATVTNTTFVFDAPSAGTYSFRSALQRNGTTASASFFSGAKSISVS